MNILGVHVPIIVVIGAALLIAGLVSAALNFCFPEN